MGSALDSLLNAPNVSEVLSSSASSSVGGNVSIVAPSIVRKKSGSFLLEASFSVTTPGGGAQGVTAQLVSSLLGSVGPTISVFATSSSGGVTWIDLSGIDVGQPIIYSLKLTPVSGSNSIAIVAGSSALVVSEQ